MPACKRSTDSKAWMQNQIQSFSPPQALLPHASFLHLCQPHVMMRLYTCLIVSKNSMWSLVVTVHRDTTNNEPPSAPRFTFKQAPTGETLRRTSRLNQKCSSWTHNIGRCSNDINHFEPFLGLMIFTKGLAYGKFHPNLVVRSMEAPLAEPVAF
jgi:hypothetical protein